MQLDGKTIQAAIVQLVDDYKFEPFQVIEIVNLGIRSAFRKDYIEFRRAELDVNIDEEWAIAIYRKWLVVEEVEDDHKEMLPEPASEYADDVEIWDEFLVDVTPEDLSFSRVWVQSAAQTIKQHLKNIEKERFYQKFQNKEGELLKGKVTKVHGDSVVLDIEWVPVVLLPEWQIPRRMYEIWEDVFVYLKQIAKGKGGVVLDITQSTPEYVEAIIRKVVPEIDEWIVIISDIVRIPGQRTKVVVSSDDEDVDPVWIMVGQKGDRVNIVLSLLEGEKVDYIQAHDNKEDFIRSCLKPAEVLDIQFEDDNKVLVSVPDNQKALAIWKGASNIRLAWKLTWYRLEVV